MADGSISCPLCHGSFELTATMSSAIKAKLRQQLDADANQRTAEMDGREKTIAEKAAVTERAKDHDAALGQTGGADCGVIESTAGMYGDLQGIAGKTLQEIEGLEVRLLGDDTQPA